MKKTSSKNGHATRRGRVLANDACPRCGTMMREGRGRLELPINGLVTSTTNWVSFSEVAFAFRVTPALLLNGMVFAVVMGIVGGVLPARKAATQPVVDALREA